MDRQIILDTETTGLNAEQGDRLIEIGCIEMINRRMTRNRFHQYVNPDRGIDAEAVKVHGITAEFLKDKPVFSQIAESLFEFLNGAELIIHNAAFDIGFLNAEFSRVNKKFSPITKYCTVIDTLAIARQKHPGQPNNLDALCRRYSVNNKHRDLHGALIDAALLSEVYLLMTGGQAQLFAQEENDSDAPVLVTSEKTHRKKPLPVILANKNECDAHQAFLASLEAGHYTRRE
ncbi:MAG: DNA polymerase III subunit epsilon [Gammaproteobacteria bacterium RIFCSPHIGHO2_12_FULL_45_9]|nr:MAG: DNA polymerase III subunit epsilon [Gammaproteobacteria bacterium RIFCSPHIGHO2_12_FULL_45_9]